VPGRVIEFFVLFASGVAACGGGPPRIPADAPPAPPPFRPTTTIEDIMRSVIDPSADAVWDAVVVDATADGIVRTEPESDADWAALRRDAVVLIEASNLLLVEGRAVARPESVSELPGVDLEPEEMAARLAESPATWRGFVERLHDSGVGVLRAVEARDVEALLEAGDRLDLACEACHSEYWYPGYGARRDELAPR